MKLSEFCIRRPVFTIVLSIVLVVIGVIGYFRLPIRQLPDIDHPVVSIRTEYPGASAALVESQVTTPLEQSIAALSGLDEITSESRQGESHIRVRFRLGVNIDQAAVDIRNDIARIADGLPSGVKTPVVSKSDYDAAETIILSVSDSKMSSMELSDYVDRYIKPQVAELSGVAQVDIFGGRGYAMWVWLNPWKMHQRNVTVNDVIDTIKTDTQNQPGGQIQTKSRYYSILTQSNLHTVKQFNDLVLRKNKDYLVRIRDVGNAMIGPGEYDAAMRVDGKPAIGIGIIAQTSANPITVAASAEHAAKQIAKTLPDGMQLKVVYNNADYVHEAMRNVVKTVLEAILLVIIVVFLFLGSWRSSFIPIVTIPVCLIAVLGFLYFVGYSINFISMLAVVLAIGLVVDDAIVMLENCYRHIEQGMAPMQAARLSSREIGFAIIAMTLTLAAVYIPIGFAQGLTGVIFRQFALTLAIAVIISGFVALTLSPMMCARMLPKRQTVNRYVGWLDNFFHRLTHHYKRLLARILHLRSVVIIVLFVLVGAGYWLYQGLPKELAPKEDYGFFGAAIQAPTDASFQYTNDYAKQVEHLFASIPQVKRYLTWVGGDNTNSAFSYVVLKPWSQRKKTLMEILPAVRQKLKEIPGVNVSAFSPSPFGGGGKDSGAVNVTIMSTDSYQQISQLMQGLINHLKSYPGLNDFQSSLEINSQQFTIHIKRNLAAELGVKVADIERTIAAMLGGNTAAAFNFNNYDYDIKVQLQRRYLGNMELLKQLSVRNDKGKMIPLATLIDIKPVVGPENLPHFNRMRSAELTAQIASGYTMGQVIDYLQQFFKQTLPQNVKYAFRGEAKRMLESRNTMNMIFGLAILFIYLIMAAQFESFIDPMIILFGVPLALVGGLLALKIVGSSLNIYSKIGLVTLIGLIAKHGILITNFANQLRRQGNDIRSAIIEAASLRLRPILMTTAAMVIGAIPLALATGAGANGRSSIGWVIVGGLLLGTFFSLFVVPVAYSYLAKFTAVPKNTAL